MIPSSIAAVPFAAELFSPRTLGEAGLVTVVAIVLGFVASRFWPNRLNPQLFGFMVALLVVSGLAYFGSAGAGLALFVVVALGALLLWSGAVS